jgi:hypothetical protein
MEKAEDEDDSVKNSKFKSVLKELARGTGNPETLEHLSKHPDDGVKAAVARNYSTPKIVRKQFLDHPNPIVRGSVELRDFPERIRAETVAKETNCYYVVLFKDTNRSNSDFIPNFNSFCIFE